METHKKPATRKLYKVLVGGYGTHQPMQWSLPKGDKPGDWHEAEGDLVLCRNGLHLTWDPAHWWKPGCAIYEAEADGIAAEDDGECKLVCRRARIMREVTDASELASVRIFVAGERAVVKGKAI